jgi:hypothetical protein
MQLRIELATLFRSYFPKKDLIEEPYPDTYYKQIWEESLSQFKQFTAILEGVDFYLTTQEVAVINRLALVSQVTSKTSQIDYSHGFLLLTLIKRIKHEHSEIDNLVYFETGTARGFSAIAVAYIANELFQNYDVTTIDVLDHHTKRYWNCIGDFNGRRTRQEVLGAYSSLASKVKFLTKRTSIYMKQNKSHRTHLAFLDGSHTYQDVRREFNWIAESQKIGDVILLDDVTVGQFDGICKFVKEQETDLRYRQITFTTKPTGVKGFAIFERIK